MHRSYRSAPLCRARVPIALRGDEVHYTVSRRVHKNFVRNLRQRNFRHRLLLSTILGHTEAVYQCVCTRRKMRAIESYLIYAGLFSLLFESFVPVFVAPVLLLGVLGAHIVSERPRLQVTSPPDTRTHTIMSRRFCDSETHNGEA